MGRSEVYTKRGRRGTSSDGMRRSSGIRPVAMRRWPGQRVTSSASHYHKMSDGILDTAPSG